MNSVRQFKMLLHGTLRMKIGGGREKSDVLYP
jgi:hypothetical protein